MTTRPAPARVPTRPVLPTPLAVPLALLGLVVVGCTATDDAWGSAVEPTDRTDPVATVDDTDVGLARDELILRDPAETGEFAPVEPEEHLDLDPDVIPVADEPELAAPEQAVAAVVEQLAATAPDGSGETLDRVPAVDDGPGPDEAAAGRDGNRRNELGELVVLDEPAALACADVEAALTRYDENDPAAAADRVTAAADRADRSTVDEIRAWAPTLAERNGDDEVAELIGFLTSCAQGGYEL